MGRRRQRRRYRDHVAERQGLSVIERGLLADAFETENLDLTHTLKDEAAILQSAQKWAYGKSCLSIEVVMTGRP